MKHLQLRHTRLMTHTNCRPLRRRAVRCTLLGAVAAFASGWLLLAPPALAGIGCDGGIGSLRIACGDPPPSFQFPCDTSCPQPQTPAEAGAATTPDPARSADQRRPAAAAPPPPAAAAP